MEWSELDKEEKLTVLRNARKEVKFPLYLKSASKKFGLLRFRLNRLIGKKQA